MILDYDRRPNATVDQKLQSLLESVQMALNETATELASVSETTVTPGGGDVQPVQTTSYLDLSHKPSIEGVLLTGDKSFPDLNLDTIKNTEIYNIIEYLT